jgi:hypothetical protein
VNDIAMVLWMDMATTENPRWFHPFSEIDSLTARP